MGLPIDEGKETGRAPKQTSYRLARCQLSPPQRPSLCPRIQNAHTAQGQAAGPRKSFRANPRVSTALTVMALERAAPQTRAVLELIETWAGSPRNPNGVRHISERTSRLLNST